MYVGIHACMGMWLCMWRFQKSGATEILEILYSENKYVCRQTCMSSVHIYVGICGSMHVCMNECWQICMGV